MKTTDRAPSQFLNPVQAMACVHCGLCLGSCPTYLETGDENESPRGRIYTMRALQDGRQSLTAPSVAHIDSCLGCRACEAACPSGVAYGALLEATRDHIEQRFERSWPQKLLRRWVIERVFPYPRRMKWALLPARLARFLKLEKVLPAFARDALALIPENLSELSLPEESPAKNKRARVGFVRGCVMPVMFGNTNANTVKLLTETGSEVFTPAAQGCCGALYAHSGNLKAARECARRNIVAFENSQLDAIIINAAGCGSTLKEYGHFLQADPVFAKRAEAFSQKVKDLTEWISPAEMPPQKCDSPVTYHDACHLAHAQRITEAPRNIIRHVVGSAFVPLPESDVCCGSAGTYNLTEPAMAARLQDRKIKNILKTGAKTVITTNPGCILQIQAGLRKAGATDVRVMHLADFLAEKRQSL